MEHSVAPPANTHQHYLNQALILALSGTALFSMKSIALKWALSQGIDPLSLHSIRMLIALPFYLLVLFWQRHALREVFTNSPSLLWHIALVGCLGFFLAPILDVSGLALISTQLERLILFTYPVLIIVFGQLFFGTAIKKGILPVVLCSYLGVGLILQYDNRFLGEAALQGSALVFAAAVSFSFYVLFSKNIMQKIDSRSFTALSMSAATIVSLLCFIVVKSQFGATQNIAAAFDDFLNWKLEIWLAGAFIAFFCTVIPSFMMAEAVKRLGAAKASIIGSAGPVLTSMFAILLLDEAFRWNHAAGLILVVSAIVYLGRPEKNPAMAFDSKEKGAR